MRGAVKAVGAAWVFTRGGGYWTHDKDLVGAAPSASADGSIIMVGRSNDNGGVGAATVFTHSGGGGSDSQEPPRPFVPSNPALNLEE